MTSLAARSWSILSNMIDYITTVYSWRNQMLYRFLRNDMQRESVKTSRGGISGVFCYTPLHKIRHGIVFSSKITLFGRAGLYTIIGMVSKIKPLEQLSSRTCCPNS